ncbi:MAG TPA: LysR family transcriptional regulator, partial [Bdellovibrionales bacterium]|nr:LysR family transcriptional regulator [Bdellovibrionales bacterium]
MEKLLSERAWELSVLSRAIVFPNLSAAANHVGLSQPQLSRIVARLEGEIGVTLLDRTVRRKSGWTPIAARLAETFLKSARNLESEVQMLVGNAQPRALSIGTLEGLTSIAITFAEQIFKAGGIKLLDLNVYDLNQLEEFFLKGDLNLIFTVREPGRRKFRHIRHLGQQVVEAQQNPSGNYSIM